MRVVQAVMDTSVFYSALRSRRGASFRLLSVLGVNRRFELNVSVPLVLEYEDVAKRDPESHGLTDQDIEDIVDYVCSVSNRYDIFYLWRPFLKDPKDDMVLELAVRAECDCIVTFNQRDFAGVESAFGIRILGPLDFLREIGELS
jgi:putative PIN family toxin of toxin-antitoxin system